MLLIFGISYILSVLVSIMLFSLVIHQVHLSYLFMGEEGFLEGSGAAFDQFNALMEQLGDNYRTFKHGALHGTLAGFFFAMPVLAINALYARKGFKYIAINGIYWMLTLGLMGGVICQWG